MPRLRDPNKQIPGGLRFRQPETAWDSTKAMPLMPSLRMLAQAVIKHRLDNPHLLKLHGWKTDLISVELEMNEYNAKLCVDNGWTAYVQPLSGEPSFPKNPPPSPSATRSVSQAVAVAVAGAKSLGGWLGEGGKPVPQELSEARASQCAVCPQNDRGDWTRFFTEPASAIIRRQIEAKNDLRIKTQRDSELQICGVCGCPLKLKVHTPIGHVRKHTTEQELQKFREKKPDCWVLTEP
jgi:hypothetical protein